MIYELRKQIEYFLRNKIYMVSLIINELQDTVMKSHTLHWESMMCALVYTLMTDWVFPLGDGLSM